MSLQLILGSSGAGKSHYLYTHIIEESMKNPDRNYIVVVPEQYTMAIQKRLVSMHPRKGILNIDVVSFERLAYKVFEEVGEDNLEVLDDTGKNLIIKRVLEQNKDRLKYFGSNLSNTGLTAADMDQTLINFNTGTTKSGTFTANGMTRTAASDDAVAGLTAKGWTVSGLTKSEESV